MLVKIFLIFSTFPINFKLTKNCPLLTLALKAWDFMLGRSTLSHLRDAVIQNHTIHVEPIDTKGPRRWDVPI